jgi:hypothetical protein
LWVGAAAFRDEMEASDGGGKLGQTRSAPKLMETAVIQESELVV